MLKIMVALFIAVGLTVVPRFAAADESLTGLDTIPESIPESTKLSAFISQAKAGDWVGLDLDFTLLIQPQAIGTDAWYGFHMNRLMQNGLSLGDAVTETNRIFRAVNKVSKIRPTEKSLPATIATLQARGVHVFAFTARGSHDVSFAETTFRQLKDLGIDFTSSAPRVRAPTDGPSTMSHATYQNGVLFCNQVNKGEALNEFLAVVQERPSRFFFADDKLKNVEQVREVSRANSISFQGVRFPKYDGLYHPDILTIGDVQLAHFEKNGVIRSDAWVRRHLKCADLLR